MSVCLRAHWVPEMLLWMEDCPSVSRMGPHLTCDPDLPASRPCPMWPSWPPCWLPSLIHIQRFNAWLQQFILSQWALNSPLVVLQCNPHTPPYCHFLHCDPDMPPRPSILFQSVRAAFPHSSCCTVSLHTSDWLKLWKRWLWKKNYLKIKFGIWISLLSILNSLNEQLNFYSWIW